MFEPSPSAGAARWPIVRVRDRNETEVIVVGMKFLALTTHWIPVGRGRSVLCCVDECALCDVLPARGFFYLPVVWDNRSAILELSALAASHFEQHCKLLHNGIRAGLKVRLARRGQKQPIRSEVVGFHDGARTIDQLTFASRVLAVYNYPPPNPDWDLLEYEQRIRAAAKVRSAREFDLYMKAACPGLPGQLG